jgi:SPP1 gp7 family putative phage head morphogenesis protein
MTFNSWLQQESIRHAVDLSHYSNAVVQKIIATLNRSDARLFAELMEAIERGGLDGFSVQRLESMLASVQALNVQAFTAVERELTAELQSFVEYELSYQRAALAMNPARISIATVSVEQVYSAAMNRPFQGVLLKGALPELGDQRMKAIRRTIAQGFVESKTTDQIVRELRGTRSKGYADGLVNRSRRDVQAVVRTALGHFAGVTQDRVMAANSDLIKALMWSATLDVKTTPECRLRDGLLYTPEDHKPIGHKVPWLAGPGRLHWSCRSGQVPVTKSWRELGIDMDEVPEGARASMDGQVPAPTTYLNWLGQQSAARQKEVLGPTRAKLFRDGGLSLADMYTQNGRYLTLDELRARDVEAFGRAGV